MDELADTVGKLSSSSSSFTGAFAVTGDGASMGVDGVTGLSRGLSGNSAGSSMGSSGGAAAAWNAGAESRQSSWGGECAFQYYQRNIYLNTEMWETFRFH